MNLFQTLKGFGKEIGIETIAQSIAEGLREGVKGVSKETGEKIIKALVEEKRGETLAFVRGLAATNPTASANLLRRQAMRQRRVPRSYAPFTPYEPGDENLMVSLLTKLYIALGSPSEKGRRVEMFEWLGRLSDEEFDSIIEWLHNDVARQLLSRLDRAAGAEVKKLGDWLDKQPGARRGR